jgi:hypothetical protein
MARQKTLSLFYSGTHSGRWARAAREAATPVEAAGECRRQWQGVSSRDDSARREAKGT